MSSHEQKSETLDVVGLAGAGPWVAAARAQAGAAISRAAIETGGFRFGKLLDLYDVNLLPGGAKYGDLPGMIALGGDEHLFLMGENTPAPPALAGSGVAGKQKAVVDWLLASPRE